MANLNPVLESTRFLTENPRYVIINDKQIERLARELAAKPLTIEKWDMPVYLPLDHPGSTDFLVLLNTLNFAFNDFKNPNTKFKTVYNGTPYEGAFAKTACLRRAIDEGRDLLDGEVLAGLTLEDCADIFRGETPIPMLEERKVVLNEIGTVLSVKYGGRFANVLKTDRFFNGQDGLVERLVNDFPSFNDVNLFQGRVVAFYKRAQLTAAMLYGRFQDNSPWSDVHALAPIADYVLPRVKRDEGILEYSPELAHKVDNGIPLQAGARDELELRAATVHSFDRLLRRVNEFSGANYAVPHLDGAVWFRGKRMKKEGKASNDHLCRTIAY